MLKATLVLIFLAMVTLIAACTAATPSPVPAATPISERPTITSTVPAPTPATPEPTKPADNRKPVSQTEDDKMFDFLTRNLWEDSKCRVNLTRANGPQLQPTCTRFEFRKGGAYSWTAISDVPEIMKNGRWNFRLTDTQSGVIFLDDGSVIAFSREVDDLIILPGWLGTLMPSKETQYGTKEALLTRDSLRTIQPSTFYKELIGTSWHKANDFDLYRQPDLITFNDDGRFFASYRRGECTHEGYWSLSGRRLTPHSDPNECDFRTAKASIAAGNSYPRIQDSLLVFYSSSYYADDQKTREKVFVFDRYGGTIEVKGEYSGTFVKDVPVPVHITFRNTNLTASYDLEQFSITQQRLKRGSNSHSSDGQQLILNATDFNGIRLAPGDTHETDVTITPTISGEYVFLGVDLRFRDSRHVFSAPVHYVVEIK